jgi:hypothetical protein
VQGLTEADVNLKYGPATASPSGYYGQGN